MPAEHQPSISWSRGILLLLFIITIIIIIIIAIIIIVITFILCKEVGFSNTYFK